MRSAIERLGPRQAVLAREDRIEACDAGRDCDEGDDGQCRVRVSLLEQPLEGYRDEDKDGRLDEVGEDAQPDESGVRDYILTVVAVATAARHAPGYAEINRHCARKELVLQISHQRLPMRQRLIRASR